MTLGEGAQMDPIARLHEIVRGIDQDESLSDDGWWETTWGVEFGAGVLAELEALVRNLTD